MSLNIWGFGYKKAEQGYKEKIDILQMLPREINMNESLRRSGQYAAIYYKA